VLGICGGYQMLGRSVADPEGVEGPTETVVGLGYLPVHTKLTGDKRVTRTQGVELATQAPFEGYEIHAGRTVAEESITPLLRFEDGVMDGAMTTDGRIAGCYVHGLFNRAEQRAAWLARLGIESDGVDHASRVDAALDSIAFELERVLDMERLIEIAMGTGR
jgi:adenosylcobyric acid synthase